MVAPDREVRSVESRVDRRCAGQVLVRRAAVSTAEKHAHVTVARHPFAEFLHAAAEISHPEPGHVERVGADPWWVAARGG